VKRIIALYLIASMMAISLTAHAEAVGPDVLVKKISEDLLAVIRQNHATQTESQEEILNFVNAKVLPHFDLVRMTRLAVGKNWRLTTLKQKNTLVAEFRNYVSPPHQLAIMQGGTA
jgi:phospholipid transport system substrate-binding protein